MTLRFFLSSIAAVLAVLALPAFGQTPGQTAAPATAQTPAPAAGGAAANTSGPSVAVAQHNCVAPAYPSRDDPEKETTQIKGDAKNRATEAYKKAVEGFNRDVKVYEECMKKFIADTKASVQMLTEAANNAVNDYNKYTAEIRQKVEAEKQ